MEENNNKHADLSRETQIHFEPLRIGASQRLAFILDQVVENSAIEMIHEFFQQLPVTMSDSDRPDTQHVRHLKHDFEPSEWQSNTIPSLLANKARDFLTQQGITCGEIYRIYSNFNLYGDFQFAHEDGEGWTALYFINSEWGEDWSGELMLYPDGDSSFAYCISPQPGRMVIFDGMIRHRGGVPSKLCFEARISLAIKFRKQ